MKGFNCVIFFKKIFIILVFQIVVYGRPKNLLFYLNRNKPWLELFFNSINTAWDRSRERWWDLIIFKSISVLENLIEYSCLKYLVHTSEWRAELLFFWISFLINFGIVSNWPIYQRLDKKIWFRILYFYFYFFILFFIAKRVVLCFK